MVLRGENMRDNGLLTVENSLKNGGQTCRPD
jgi:hypothetical protein